MPRPPALTAEQKTSIILSVLAGRITAAEAARRAGVSGQAISSWKRRFIEAGREGFDAGSGEQHSRELQLLKEITMLKSALGESYLQLQALRSGHHGGRVLATGARRLPGPPPRALASSAREPARGAVPPMA